MTYFDIEAEIEAEIRKIHSSRVRVEQGPPTSFPFHSPPSFSPCLKRKRIRLCRGGGPVPSPEGVLYLLSPKSPLSEGPLSIRPITAETPTQEPGPGPARPGPVRKEGLGPGLGSWGRSVIQRVLKDPEMELETKVCDRGRARVDREEPVDQPSD